jgi:hypothetical protein
VLVFSVDIAHPAPMNSVIHHLWEEGPEQKKTNCLLYIIIWLGAQTGLHACFTLVSSLAYSSALKLKAVCSSITSIDLLDHMALYPRRTFQGSLFLIVFLN